MQGIKDIQPIKPVRKVWVDYAKVLGMVLIVWGHCAPSHLSAFAYAFDVQLFFWVSGYLTKNKVLTWHDFLSKSLRTLFVPMLLICMIALCLSAMMGRSEWTNLPYSLVLVLAGFHSLDGVPGCGAMWFVYTLMLIRVIHNLTAGKYKLQFIISIAFLCSAMIFNRLGIEVANAWVDLLLAYPFFFIGNLCANTGSLWLKNRLVQITPPTKRTALQSLIVIALALVVYCISRVNGIAYMYQGAYGENMALFLIGSLVGIWMMVIVSQWFEKLFQEKIAVLSSGTILMLGFQSHFFRLLTAVLHKVGITSELWSFDVLTLLGSIAIVIAFYPIILFVKRYCPILMGMRK